MKLAEFREGVPGAEAKPGRAPGMIDGGPVQRLEVVDRRAGGSEEGHGLGLGVIGAKRFRLARAPVARSAVAGEDETDRRMLPVAKVAAADLEQAPALCAAIDVSAISRRPDRAARRPHPLPFLTARNV